MIWLSCSLCGCFLETIQESQQKRFPLGYKKLPVCTLHTLDNAIPNLIKMICPFRDKDERTGALTMFRRLCLAQGHFSLIYTHRNDSLYRRPAIEGQSLSTHSAIVLCISLTYQMKWWSHRAQRSFRIKNKSGQASPNKYRGQRRVRPPESWTLHAPTVSVREDENQHLNAWLKPSLTTTHGTFATQPWPHRGETAQTCAPLSLFEWFITH